VTSAQPARPGFPDPKTTDTGIEFTVGYLPLPSGRITRQRRICPQ